MSNFNKEKFMEHLKREFSPMDNHFTYDMVENLVDYAMQHESHSKDSLCYFLSDIIEQVEFGEVAAFEDDSNLTSFGLEEKRKALMRFSDFST